MKYNYKSRSCLICGIEFIPNSSSEKYCGSRKEETGCKWITYKEQSKQAKIRYYENNKELVKQRVVDWQKSNPERVKEFGANNRAKFADKTKIRHSEYKKNNKDKTNALTAKRHASKINATPKWANLKAITEIYSEAQRLSKSTGIQHHVDHIIPLKNKLVCGLHVHWNLRVITFTENVKKHNSFKQSNALAY